jgi:hypothetical protein
LSADSDPSSGGRHWRHFPVSRVVTVKLELCRMRVRITRHLVDLAGSGLVLIGFLLAAMALSAVPVVVKGLARHPAEAGAAGGHGRSLSAPARPAS